MPVAVDQQQPVQNAPDPKKPAAVHQALNRSQCTIQLQDFRASFGRAHRFSTHSLFGSLSFISLSLCLSSVSRLRVSRASVGRPHSKCGSTTALVQTQQTGPHPRSLENPKDRGLTLSIDM